MTNKPIHILRYGTVADKAHLKTAISAYDYLSINGNTAAYVSKAIAKFIVEEFFSETEKGKGFFIDPITYAFQRELRLLKSVSKNTGETTIKKSVGRLIEIYGDPVSKVRDDIPIAVSDFSSDQLIEDFCAKVLGFQYDLVIKHIVDNDLQKYLEYVVPGGIIEIQQFRPKFLIAPYFYLDAQDSAFDNWLDINVKFAEEAARQASNNFRNIDVFAQIVLSKSVLRDHSKIQKIIENYKGTNCKGYTIWVDDLDENESSNDELNGFVDLLKALRSHKKPIYNMYGGYFSIMLTHKKVSLLNGVSHGLEYGESRKVYPVGGGVPVSKYYYYPLHQRLDFTKAFYLLKHANAIDTSLDNWGSADIYHDKICNCRQCHNVIKKEMINFLEFESTDFYNVHIKGRVQRRKKASSDTKKNCLYHYLLCKKVEFRYVSMKSNDELLKQLEEQKTFYMKCDALQDGELDYIGRWIKTFKKAVEVPCVR